MPNVTYGRLEQVLLALGFALKGIYQNNKVYIHAQTGALVTFPEVPADQEVIPLHLVGVRGTLDNFGIADPKAFEADLRRAS